jgi:putative ABC transport system permease protein
MLSHLFKLIWNKKKQNFLLILEIFIAFLGLFAGFTFILYPYNNHKLPLGFQPEGVWAVDLPAADNMRAADSLQVFRESVKRALLGESGVEAVTFSTVNYPFSGNGFNSAIRFNKDVTWAHFKTTEDNYLPVMGMKLVEGRWFSAADQAANVRPAVINEALKKIMFGNDDALGKMVEAEAAPGRMRIVGVVADTKDESEGEAPAPGIYRRMDTADLRYPYSVLIKVKPDADAALESRLHKTLSRTVKGADIEIRHITELMEQKNKEMLVPRIIFFIIAGFLVINVALGIFGVLWYNINKRRGEIGLRRAVGASGKSISGQLVAEAVLLATLSLVVGLFFTVQLPLLNVLQLPDHLLVSAMVYAVLFIYGLVIACALYPGRQAAAIYPAVALHED